MPLQLSISFDIHGRENNPLSQAHLDANRDLFTESVFNVLKCLAGGTELTTDNARELAGTRSLPRRILDLRLMGIPISEDWILINERRSHKKWFMTTEDKITALKIIMSKLKTAA